MELSQNLCNATCLTLQLHSINRSTEILFKELSSLINLYHLFIYSVGKILSQSCLLTQSFLNNNFDCKTIGDIKPWRVKKHLNQFKNLTFCKINFVRNFDEITKIKYKFIIIFIPSNTLNFAIFRFILLENVSELHLNGG